jgi:hypothetical protein
MADTNDVSDMPKAKATSSGMSREEVLETLKADEKSPEFIAKVVKWMDDYTTERKAAFADDGPGYWFFGMAPPMPKDVNAWFVEVESR